jgi:ABC-type sugar transport system substrate-binding protein
MACGAIRAVREEGLKVPGDVAFIGFDDLPIAATPEFMLTTVRQPIVQFGAKAVEILIDLIENGNKPSRCVIMDTELIIRKSCGAVYKNGHSNGGNQAQDFWNAVGPNRIISPYNHEEVENKR